MHLQNHRVTDRKDLFQLLQLVWPPRERWRPLQHLDEDAPRPPDGSTVNLNEPSGSGRSAGGALTTCPEPRSNRWSPAARQGGGTTGSPPQRRRSDWEWTWTWQDLNQNPEKGSCSCSDCEAAHNSLQGAFLTKVGQFQFPQVADEQVLRFQISVKDPAAVDVAETAQQLEHEDLEQTQSPRGAGSRGGA